MRLPSQKSFWTETGHGGEWKTHFDPWPEKFSSYYNESKLAAAKIADTRLGQIHILYSGGIDSEYVLHVFREMGIPFVPVIIKMSMGLNYHDLRYAMDFCQRYGLNPKIIDIDYEKFVNSGEMLSIAEEMETHIYHYTTLAKACSQLDGTVLVCAGEPEVRLVPETGNWNVTINEYDFANDRFFKKRGIHGTPSFPTCTPEMIMSFLTHPAIRAFAEKKRLGRIGSNSGRRQIYTEETGFNIIERPKYTGYEIIEQQPIFNHETFAILKDREKMYSGIFSEDYYKFIDRFKSGN